MLQHISIKNYALIQELSIDFSEGLSIITGETGAGKSILLGALGLVLGNRADSSTLLDLDKKCVVEATLKLSSYGLESFFEEQDLDFESITILRREILPSGKSRAFVNDSPVRLQVLTELKIKLIDIHSQHQTLQISDTQFQFQLIDSFSDNNKRIDGYKKVLFQWQKAISELENLKTKQKQARQQYDYNLHLFNELHSAKIVVGEQEELEEKLEKLNNIEDIKSNLSEALQLAIDENIGAQSLLVSLKSKLQSIASFSREYKELFDRINSLKIEFDDIIVELENENENVDYNPNEIEEINERLQLLYTLQKKHYASNAEELILILNELSEKVLDVENAQEFILEKENQVNQLEKELNEIANLISESRKIVIPNLVRQLETIIADLGMPQAKFNISISASKNFLNNGKDNLSFLFSANKGGNFGDLKKVASGGELSRIMLAIKKVLSENSQLPTIIFDEIDTGVSGEISNKMASIMQQMSTKMQVITITHLPQIAAKGNQHYKVFKEEIDGVVQTNLKLLSKQERIIEIAEMLSGKDISESAMNHSKELLN